MNYKFIATNVKSNSAVRHQPDIGRSDLNVLLAGEEEFTRLRLCNILMAEEGVNIIGEAVDVADMIEKINRLRPDLVFMDMEMQGFDAIEGLVHRPEVVLTSTRCENAIHAFEASALDFLLKPICADRVKKTISRARKVIAPEQKIASPSNLLILPDDCERKPSVSRLAVHKGKRVLLLNLKDIYYVKVENRLVFAFTKNDQLLVNRTITEMEELLRDDGFVQINRGTLINLDYLMEIIPWFSGTCRLKLINGMEFPLSRDRVAMLKARVGLSKKWSGK